MPEVLTFQSLDELEDLVQHLESCELRGDEFHHAHHIAVALWYAGQYGYEQGLARMRTSLQRFAKYHGSTKYHETITVFWMKLISSHLFETTGPVDLVAQANQLIANCKQELLFCHYRRESVFSDRAKEEWVEPDLKPLPPAERCANRRAK